MAAGFEVEGDDVGTGLGKGLNHFIHRLHHQMHIQRHGGIRLERGAHHRPESKVGHVVVVHHIKMDPIGPGGNHALHFFTQTGEIGR